MAALLFDDFYHDLAAYTVKQVQEACEVWRRNQANRFFPSPGQFLGVLQAETGGGRYLPTFRGHPALSAPLATKSVAQVLTENGFPVAAEQWETWKMNRAKP